MKKILCAMLSLLLLLTAVGCTAAKTEGAMTDLRTEPTNGVTETVSDPAADLEREKMAAANAPLYASAEEWAGQETRAYPELNNMASRYILDHPEGSPDPVWNDTYGYDRARVICKTDREGYSISAADTVSITVSYLQRDVPTGNREHIRVHDVVNIERWNGSAWDRLICLSSDHLSHDGAAKMNNQKVYVGESLDVALSLDDVISALTPGRYRAVVYVCAEKYYAEFELIS